MPAYVDEAERGNVLATVGFGVKAGPDATVPWLSATIPTPPLSPFAAEEVWPAVGAVSRVTVGGAPAAADDRSLFVAVETATGPGSEFDALTFEVYRRILSGVVQAGYPHVLRVWNYVPQIHEMSSGFDRYMLFCKGRSEAFAAHYGPAFSDRLPAASAVGCNGDSLVVHVLAARERGTHIENPRQVAAYRYPERYGPKSPSFARATVAGPAWHGSVFVSGTASIVGHESVFPGDAARQTEETMRNIEVVLDAAGVPGRGGPIGPRLRSLRVYVRFPDQLETIRAAIEAATRSTVPTVWLQAEVCRPELLVEIEATARTR
jgi:chorismate lyase/3-hydroxybenzoate synthase